MRSRIVVLLAVLMAVPSPSRAEAQKKPAIVADIPFEQIRNLLPKDGDAITVWKGRVAWPRDRHAEQRQEYGEIAFGRLIRSHPNDRNDRDQAWLRPGILARDGYLEIRAGWRVKIDGKPGSPHYDGLIRTKLRIRVEKGQVKTSLDDLQATHRGSNGFISLANLFGANINVAGMVKKAIEAESTKVLGTLNEKIDALLKQQPQLQQFRERIAIEIIGAPQQPPRPGFEKLLFDAGIYDRPNAKLGTVRISVQVP